MQVSGMDLACIEERRDEMQKVILATHGELSKGMLNSISMIVGDLAKDIKTYSLFPGENPNDYYEQLKEEVEHSDSQYTIICDIKGGSVHTTLSKLIVYPNVTIISGMNMNLVLDVILTYKDELNKSSYESLICSAKEGITILKGSLMNKEDEEF